MNGATRRRGLMSKDDEAYVVNSTDSPQLMERIYNNGWCASVDGITAKEAALVTNTQLSSKWGRTNENVSLLQMTEPFDGFKYFTGITTLPLGLFRKTRLTSLELPPTVTVLKNNVFRQIDNSNLVLKFPNITTIGTWCFYFSVVKCLDFGPNLTTLEGDRNLMITSGTIIVRAINPPTCANTSFINSGKKVYVPDESVELYNANTYWGQCDIKPLSEIE